MAIEKVGYCRLYDSIGCSLSNEEELEFKIDIGDVQSIVYIGIICNCCTISKQAYFQIR